MPIDLEMYYGPEEDWDGDWGWEDDLEDGCDETGNPDSVFHTDIFYLPEGVLEDEGGLAGKAHVFEQLGDAYFYTLDDPDDPDDPEWPEEPYDPIDPPDYSHYLY